MATLTPKAQQEISKLIGEIKEIDRQRDNNNEKYRNPNTDSWMRKQLQLNNNSTLTKKFNKENKINFIEKIGCSTLEMSGLKRELCGFKSLTHGGNFYSRDQTKVGYSKKLGKYVIVSYTKWSSFMGNIRGCSSIANTTDIKNIKIISKAQYDSIMKQETKPTRRPKGRKIRRESYNTEALLRW